LLAETVRSKLSSRCAISKSRPFSVAGELSVIAATESSIRSKTGAESLGLKEDGIDDNIIKGFLN
jgi:hypothetical protein